MTIKFQCMIVSRDWSRSWLSLVHIDDSWYNYNILAIRGSCRKSIFLLFTMVNKLSMSLALPNVTPI